MSSTTSPAPAPRHTSLQTAPPCALNPEPMLESPASGPCEPSRSRRHAPLTRYLPRQQSRPAHGSPGLDRV